MRAHARAVFLRNPQERTLKKYSDDILRILEALSLRVNSLEESHDRLAGTVKDLTAAVVDLKDSNIAVSRSIIDRADAFQGTLDTASANVQILRDKQVRVHVLLPEDIPARRDQGQIACSHSS